MIQCNCDFCSKVLPHKNHRQRPTIWETPRGPHLRKVSRTFVNPLRCCYGFSVSPLVSCGRILIPHICSIRGWSFMGKCLGQRWILVIGLVPCCGSQWAILELDPCGKTGFVAKWGSSLCFVSFSCTCSPFCFLPWGDTASAFYHGVTQHEFITRNWVDVMILGFPNLPYG